MESRREADPMRVFHLFERLLDVGLGSAAQNDFLCGPVVVIGTEDAFAEAGAFEIFKGDGIYPKGKVEPPEPRISVLRISATYWPEVMASSSFLRDSLL